MDNKSTGEVFIKEIGFIADTVIIDPDYWLITKNNSSEKINEVNEKNIIRVFPSPFLKNIYAAFYNFGSNKASLKIYDSKGTLMMKNEFTINGSLFYQVNTESFARGIYFIKIQTDNGVKFAKKILKQ